MGIDVETWRARIGLYHAASVGRHLKRQQKASTAGSGRVKSSGGVSGEMLNCLLHFLVTCLIALLYTDLRFVIPYLSSSMKFKGFDRKVLHFVSSGMKVCRRVVLRGLAIPKSTVVALSFLLIISGDVELNPGPVTARVDDSLTLKNLVTELSGFKNKWHEIGVQLNINPSDLKCIENDYRNQSSRLLSEMLQHWLKGNSDTPLTWQTIVDVLGSDPVAENGLASRIRARYCESAFNEASQAELTTQSDLNKPLGPDPNKKETVQKQTPTTPFPFLDVNVASLNQREKESLEIRLERDTRNIKDEFCSLLSTFCQSLIDHAFPLENFVRILQRLEAYDPIPTCEDRPHEQKTPLLHDYKGSLKSAESMDDAFDVLKGYCSFFDFEIVKKLIKELGTETDKSCLTRYMKKFEEYAKRKVYECPSKLKEEGLGTPLCFKVDSKYKCYKLSYIRNELTFLLCEILKLSVNALVLCRLDEGCVELTFEIPSFLPPTIFPLSLDQITALSNLRLGVLSLSTDDYRVAISNEVQPGSVTHSIVEPDHELSPSPSVTSDNCLQHTHEHDSINEPESQTERSNATTQFSDDISPSDPILEHTDTLECSPDHAKEKTLTQASASFDQPLQSGLIAKQRTIVNDENSNSSSEIMAKFTELVNSFCASLCKQHYKPLDLVSILWISEEYYVFQDDPQKRQNLFKGHERELDAANSMEDVFDVIKQHCSFFNYDLIESLIKAIGTDVDKQRLCEYLKHFNQYAERRLCKCPSKLNWVPVTAGKGARLVLKLASKCCTYTANEIRQLRIHICEALGLQLNFPYALMFEEWRKNGEDIELVFQAPCVLKPGLSPEQQRILDGHSVLSFSDNGCNKIISSGLRSKDDVVESAEIFSRSTADCDSGIGSMTNLNKQSDFSDDYRFPGDPNPKLLSGIDKIPENYADLSEDELNLCYSDKERLQYSSYLGNLEDVQHLILDDKSNTSCSSWTVNDYGFIPLHLACESGKLEVVRFLATDMQKNGKTLESLLKMKTNDGRTPLHLASGFGHLDIVDYLISELKCDPNLRTRDYGMTPLNFAARGGHLDIVRYLITKKNCNPMVTTTRNYNTPLHNAAQFGHLDVVKYLVETHKCNPCEKAKQDCLPLHFACENGHLDVVKYLLDEDVLKNHDMSIEGTLKCQIVDGCTPLHLASYHGHLDIVKFLTSELIQKCDPSVTTPRFEMTPLHFAARDGHLPVVKYLVTEQRCDPMRKTKHKQNTSLHLAAREGKLEVVKFFVETCHCHINERGYLGRTPLQWARSNGHEEVAQYLEQ